jgi:hypothetical protein
MISLLLSICLVTDQVLIEMRVLNCLRCWGSSRHGSVEIGDFNEEHKFFSSYVAPLCFEGYFVTSLFTTKSISLELAK